MTTPTPDKVRTPSEVLRAARELISVPERWTQDATARSVKRRPVLPRSQKAVCWCSVGAIDRATESTFSPEAMDARSFLRDAAKTNVISTWNDMRSRTHAEVLAAFDRAIVLADDKEEGR